MNQKAALIKPRVLQEVYKMFFLTLEIQFLHLTVQNKSDASRSVKRYLGFGMCKRIALIELTVGVDQAHGEGTMPGQRRRGRVSAV